MAGVKRKSAELAKVAGDKKSKKSKSVSEPKSVKAAKKSKKEPEDIVESDTTESEHGFYGYSAKNGDEQDGDVNMESEDEEEGGVSTGIVNEERKKLVLGADGAGNSSSRESHQKQKQLAKDRKAAKPHADDIQRSKKIWERLRRKSHVPKEERDALTKELFEIITGRVKDFVFKHDSVRVIQCALKYSNPAQRKMIAKELKGEFKGLAESRYAKFLVGKILVEGDQETRDMVIAEFYGHVRRMINHPEASWILDDIYRGMATPKQKAMLLREWYGPEFAIFKLAKGEEPTATLSEIFEKTPEKRKPIMEYLHHMINQLIQKKLTGFTMLHDAMLQYFLNTKPGSDEATEFLELLKGDEEGDLLKNLAFTRNGARVACLALAYGTAKDRKNILKVYKKNIEIMAHDNWAHQVLLTALDVVDDTVLTAKSIFPELLATDSGMETQQEKLLELANSKIGRITVLYPIVGRAKWLFPTNDDLAVLDEVHEIRKTTSKKDAEARRKEVVKAYSGALLSIIAADPLALAESSFGCQFITEALLGTEGDKTAAVDAVAAIAGGDPKDPQHLQHSSFATRMFKTLISGGHFDAKTKQVVPVEPPLGFGNKIYAHVREWLVDWATGESSFVVVALAEAQGGFAKSDEVLKKLRKAKKELERAARGEGQPVKKKDVEEGKSEGAAASKKAKGKKDKSPAAAAAAAAEPKGNAGARILLGML
ncbi:uncharacterized protein K452DRAFT_324524 [Aplosporella prunicola CBS 121167]|uniref:PUM-HD domain-containing protein n=1 Tax=Aplosporella prunicola CBS 121167 TaxID=1176127 RepID=A0A6A6BQJ4_9PEZI|nr:uncharacterized protein K452DRAFT_324524 [Aplosporella prunicola CBS 121167]KAF2145575.1 hypothetical protein K452DRAFT_324524 [Aplosporella prunicola CBS 121167]